jgi:hypothetical protein
MKYRFILVILSILLLSVTLAGAKGGGGGGSSPSGGSSSSGSGEGIFFNKLECSDAGRLTFDRKPQLRDIVFAHSDGTIVSPEGKWDGNTFISEEAEFLKQGSYTLKDELFGEKKVECPGLKFSCKLVKIDVKECKLDGKDLSAEFLVEEADVADLKYGFSQATARELTYTQTSFDSALKNLKVSSVGSGVHKLDVEDIGAVQTLQVSHPKCVGEYYVYSTIDCVKEDETSVQQVLGDELKCGGYLDIGDRVRCRVSLREEDEDVYENFYPEECKAWEDNKPKCLEFYRSVQQCWKFPNGDERISCVKKQVGLGDIKQEKEACADDSCLSKLKEKVYAVIKFRLYNLEEEAEQFYEQGRISKDQLVDFVVKTETSKLEFNRAANKQGRVNVILNVKRYWQGLLKVVE